MRHLLLLLLLLLSPRGWAQEEVVGPRLEAGHAQGQVEPALVPTAPPGLVVGAVDTPRFHILYTARSQESSRQLASGIESIRDAFVSVLGRDWPGTTEVRVGMGREEFEALALPGGEPPGWAVALAYPAHRIILLNAQTLAGPEGQVTLRHELAHVALGQLAPQWPRWFQEGLAQHLTGENLSMTHYAALFSAVAQEKVFRFEHLAEEWPDLPSDVEIAYAQSAAFVAWLSSHYGPEGMGRLVDEVATGQPFEQAFGKAFHTSLWVEEQAWREGLAARYGWLPLTTSTSLLWLLIIVLGAGAYLRLRTLKEQRLVEMDAREAAEEAAMREALEAELAQQRAALVPPELASPSEAPETLEIPEWYEPASPPGVEHDEDEDTLSQTAPRPAKPTVH
ncbi:MAG TPA: peptidase MA family metallohydrolase [Cystobacter sp.]